MQPNSAAEFLENHEILENFLISKSQPGSGYFVFS